MSAILQERKLYLWKTTRTCAGRQKKICATPDTVFIYGMGFSSMMANYLGKKLLVLGIKCILSDGADSIGIFENNMESIGVFIAFSRSGRSPYVLNRVKTAERNSIFTVGFTMRETVR